MEAPRGRTIDGHLMRTHQAPGGWFDASLPIAPDSVAWAGLALPRLAFDARIDRGAAVNVGRLECSLHTGTHADAPLHVVDGGPAIDLLAPEAFIGPALVVHTHDPEAITLAELQAAGVERARPDRVLVATPLPYDGRHFPERVPFLAPDAAELLVALGVRLVGVNVPSIDPLDSRTMDAHKILFAAGTAVLENLDLAATRPGPHEIAAAPLRIVGGDAAPVRALLRRLT